MRDRAFRFLGLASVVALGLLAGAARAQDYPPEGRPVTIIVPYPAGGGTDTSARMMAAGLERELHASFQVVNRVGAASQVGMSELARAKPDGLTLGYAVLPTVATNYLDPKRQAIYTRTSFAPIATHYISAMMLAVRSDAPYKTLHDLVEAARAAPGSIRISDSGLLGTPHSTALMLALASGVKFTYVHFGGGPPSVTALLGGHVEVLAGGISDALPQLRAGTFRILGLAAEARDANIPDVPTMREQGYDVLSASIGTLVAPAGTPPAILAKLTAAAKIVVADPDQAKKLADFGSAPYFNGPEAATRIWIDTETRVKPLLEQASGP